MKHSQSLPRRLFAACLASASLGLGSAAWAADPPDIAVEFPAGLACSNFGLRVEIWEGKGRVRELKDKNGAVRSLFAGTGGAFRLTNLLNSKSMSTRSNGASALTETRLVDGTTTVTVRGHLLLIWFPSDLPPGPWTSLHEGHTVYSLSPYSVGTLQSMNGNSTDVCSALT